MRQNLEKHENDFSDERERHINNIARALKSSEFQHVAMGESIGGNAGNGRLAVNAFADVETGEVIALGNFQDIKENIRNNPKYAAVTFLCELDIKKDGFRLLRVVSGDPMGFSRKISKQALSNLESALELANNE